MIFYFEENRLAFIHIPKTGGTSIRRALGDSPLSMAQGVIPAAWNTRNVVAAVRNPVDRFLSGFNMFKFGAPDTGGYYGIPRLPDLSVADALKILVDEGIPYDRTERNDVANFKHHVWPQTSDFHCLSSATDLLRYENLKSDAEKFLVSVGVPVELPHLRVTANNPNRLVVGDLTNEELSALEQFYSLDFYRLNYERQTAPESAIMVRQDPNPLRILWRVYFENVEASELSGSEVLPDPEVDLAAFLDERIEVKPEKTWPGRRKDLLEHFKRLENEFSGRMRLSHLMACTVVVLRREKDCEEARRLFFRLIEEYGAELAEDLNLRWLTSVCDTLVDTGKTELDRALALNGSIIAGLIKLAETERRLFCPPMKWPPRVRYSRGGVLFDGVISYWAEGGDMIDNLLHRISSTVESDSTAAPFVGKIIERVVEENTVISRMWALHGQNIPLNDKPTDGPGTNDSPSDG
ncbi:sulfotransferase family 2 domain-containing protein [Gymnodinialimonas ceratoperidinii]|uniref:Sulfotransferase family protein n=1 Tax=Gymnodinialimonas ceratoperidinii TaxID=2856823 RepID=A0A8F6YC33_9RHOB|nr:sulfotransferase family 2 domain-containing protein [Gymnodinialimonas ceratoperidinii]QXT41153.1 sulfotransferase family protein [Gymnodinialimonas ceratoperidinii]